MDFEFGIVREGCDHHDIVAALLQPGAQFIRYSANAQPLWEVVDGKNSNPHGAVVGQTEAIIRGSSWATGLGLAAPRRSTFLSSRPLLRDLHRGCHSSYRCVRSRHATRR